MRKLTVNGILEISGGNLMIPYFFDGQSTAAKIEIPSNSNLENNNSYSKINSQFQCAINTLLSHGTPPNEIIKYFIHFHYKGTSILLYHTFNSN